MNFTSKTNRKNCIAYIFLATLPSTCFSWMPFTSSSSTLLHITRSTTSRMHRSSKCTLSMKVKVGLVGLPNVGKSTLFNAIAQKSLAQAKNFPFCTIEPNTTPIPIPDTNLQRIATVAKSMKSHPANMVLIDVAGLVKGASRGEGLGNRFLATIRECDVIVHVVRNYLDDDVIHVNAEVDPVSDAEVVNLELLLADLSHVQRRLERTTCTGEERDVLLKVEKGLGDGLPARAIGLSPKEEFAIKSMGLLTLKRVIYAFNVDDIDFTMSKDELLKSAEEYMKQIQYCDLNKDTFTVVSAKLEAELGLMSIEERIKYLESLGVDTDPDLAYHSLPLLVKDLLNLSLVYTGPGVPPERSRTTKTHVLSANDMSALDLASKLHGDIQRGFIHAEVTNSYDLMQHDSYIAAKEAGIVRMEGKEYILKNDDVVLIKWR